MFIDPPADMADTEYISILTPRSSIQIEANVRSARNQDTTVPAPTSSPNPFAIFAPTPESSQILEGLSSSPPEFMNYQSSSMAPPQSSVQLSDLIGEDDDEDEGYDVFTSINLFGAFSV